MTYPAEPWRPQRPLYGRGASRAVVDKNGVVIVRITTNGMSGAQADRVMHKLAAAPCLLGALQRLLAMVTDGIPQMGDTEPVKQARAAITRATLPDGDEK